MLNLLPVKLISGFGQQVWVPGQRDSVCVISFYTSIAQQPISAQSGSSKAPKSALSRQFSASDGWVTGESLSTLPKSQAMRRGQLQRQVTADTLLSHLQSLY